MKKNNPLTTSAGIPIGDNTNSLTSKSREPLFIQNWQLFEKSAHFHRQRIPEGMVHTKSTGIFGTLTIMNDLTKYSKNKIFSTTVKKADCFVCSSTVVEERKTADAEHDVHEFPIKIYTEEMNWNLASNNTSMFFIRDSKMNLSSNTAQRDFWSLFPESLHEDTILFSKCGLPKTSHHMNGYARHTYNLINEKNERFWVKTIQGNPCLPDEKSIRLIGQDRKSHQLDLFYAIDKGDLPKWQMMIHVMTDIQAEKTIKV